MFAIYGISGPIFQGTLEALNRMPPIARRRSTRRSASSARKKFSPASPARSDCRQRQKADQLKLSPQACGLSFIFILITQNIDLTQIPICNFWKNGV